MAEGHVEVVAAAVGAGSVFVYDVAEDGLAVEIDSAVVVFASVSLVAGSLQLGGVVLPLLLSQLTDALLGDFW